MINLLTRFNTHSEYSAFIRSEEYAMPNVSYCVEQDEVHYGPIEDNNIVTYTSFEAMPINNYGINPNAFCATFVSHSYNEQTGVGTLIFEDDVTCADSVIDNSDILRSLTLPSTVERITLNVGLNFEALTIKALTPPSFIFNCSADISSVVIYVPEDAVNDYKTSEYWSTYAAQIQPIRG